MGDPVVGFKYKFGIHMGLSRGPVDELREIKVGDKTAWRGSVTGNTQFQIDAPELFGGEKGEGGIQGTLTTLFGADDQVAHPDMAVSLKTPMPGFRGMLTCFFDGIVAMINPYPKPWKFRVRRALKGWENDDPWYPEKAVISMVREVSAAETGGSAETKTISANERALPVPADEMAPLDPPWTITLPSLPGLAIFSVSVPTYVDPYGTPYPFGDGGSDYRSVPLEEGVHYTIAGNVVTFIDLTVTAETMGGEGEMFTITNNYVGRYIDVGYTYEKTTVDPSSIETGDGLIQAMNPVHIIYECMTNHAWGRGFDRARMDDASWRYAADQCFNEKFGLCIRWTRREEISQFIALIVDHIGCAIHDDRRTGLIKIRLIRDDYRKEDLTLFDKNSGLLNITEASVSTLAGMVNEMRVIYRDCVTDQDRTERVPNLAALQAAGGVVRSATKNYPGCPTAELANKLARRDLKALSPSIRRFTVELDRRGFQNTPGGLFRVQDMERSIPDMVLRIGTVDYGQEGNGKIIINCVQDIFALPQRGYTTIGPPQWTPPSNQVCIAESRAFEVPYRMLYRSMNPADFAFIDPTSAFLGTVCQEGQPLNSTYAIAVKSGAPNISEEPPDDSYVCSL